MKGQNMTIKVGSRWWAGSNKKFLVLAIVEASDGNVWVHYRDDRGQYSSSENCKEYSCYKESFLQRFSPLPE